MRRRTCPRRSPVDWSTLFAMFVVCDGEARLCHNKRIERATETSPWRNNTFGVAYFVMRSLICHVKPRIIREACRLRQSRSGHRLGVARLRHAWPCEAKWSPSGHVKLPQPFRLRITPCSLCSSRQRLDDPAKYDRGSEPHGRVWHRIHLQT